MTAAQLAAREAFVDGLQGAGWDVAGWEHLFENGASLLPEAQAERTGDAADLRLGYWMGDGYVLLECADRARRDSLRVRLYPRDTVDAIVAHVVRWQSRLDPDTFAEFAEQATACCRGVFLEVDGAFVSIGAAGEGDGRPS